MAKREALPGTIRRLRRDELDVKALEMTKAELSALPRTHLSFYLYLGQHSNEIAMLYSLLLRCLNEWQRNNSRPEREAAEGMTFFLVRMLCGRIWEVREHINSPANGRLFEELWSDRPSATGRQAAVLEAISAKKKFNRSISANSTFKWVRNKVAFHLDPAALEAGFDRMPADIAHTDFHTGRRGTTFFGIADTAAAFAADHLEDRTRSDTGLPLMVNSVHEATQAFRELADGYLLGFYLRYLGAERLRSAPTIRLRGLPDAERARIGFFMAGNAKRLRRTSSLAGNSIQEIAED